MKIIVLAGLPDTGKTETFNLLYDRLNSTENPTPREQLGGNERDFRCIFKEQSIGLVSMGDNISYTRTAFLWALQNNLKVLVYAYSRSFRSFIATFDRIANENIEIEFVAKTISVNRADFDRINREDVEKILSLIK